ncbi:hypothetical protein C0995_006484, partial [Termitomyces sp. Mi166
LLEHEHATQEFITAADAVFFKAQGLATLAPLHKMVFSLLEGLLDDWRLLNLTSIEWLCKAEQAPWSAEFKKVVVSWKHAISTIEQIKLMHFEKMAIELELTVPSAAPKTVVNPAPTPVSASPSIQHSTNARKGKAKATEDDDDKEEATQKFRKELEDFVVPTTFDDKLLASLLLPPSEYYEEDIGLPQGAKILGGRKGDITLVSPATRALVLEKNGAMRIDSDSDEEEEEDRVCVIKKIKQEHIEEPTGTKKRKEIIELNEEVEIVVPKAPVVGPLHLTSKPIVLVPSMPKPVPKLIIVLASPVAGPSTVPIVPSSVPKPAAAAALSTPTPVKPAGPAIKGGFIFKDPFMVRHFKLAGTEESRALIINQATEVPATQGTMPSEDSSDEDAQGDDDNSDDGDVAMDVDSTKWPEETWPVAPTKTTVTEVKVPAPAPVLVADKTEEDSLLQVILY